MSPTTTAPTGHTYGIHQARLALWVLGFIVLAASATAFAESYNGLRKWAEAHRVTGVWADIWPLQVDTFIAAGELALLLAALYRWPLRVRVLAWTVSLTGLGVSVVCNAGHVGATASLADHLTASLPPVAAVAGLVIALSVIKQVSSMPDETKDRAQRPVGYEAVRQHAAPEVEQAPLEVLQPPETPALPEPPEDSSLAAERMERPEPAEPDGDIPPAPAVQAPADPVPAAVEPAPPAEDSMTTEDLLRRYEAVFGSETDDSHGTAEGNPPSVAGTGRWWEAGADANGSG